MKNSPFGLRDRTIWVTGASSGIGRATAIMSARMGARLVLTGRDEARLEDCRRALSGDGHVVVPADLNQQADLDRLLQVLPELDGAVFAAGVAEVVPFRMIGAAHVQRQMQVNFQAPILLTQGLLKAKKLRSGASLVYVTAVAEHVCPVGSAIYSASKAALDAAVRSLALELAKFKMRANCVSPGYVRTPMIEKLGQASSVESYFELIPLGVADPEDVAGSVVYLLSPAARWVTRTALVVDGGLSLRVR